MTKNDLPTVSIKGKDYVMVKDRIAYFNEAYPNGRIDTDYVIMDKKVIVKACVTPDVKNLDRFFTGHSQADETQGVINKTSALENAETSAVGRALAMMGIGVVDSVASAEEVKKAVDPTAEWKTPNADKPDTLSDFPDKTEISGAGPNAGEICPLHKVVFKDRHGSADHRKKEADGTWYACQGKGWHLAPQFKHV